MKKHRYIALVLIVVLFVIPTALHAAGFGMTSQPVGGRVVAGPSELSEIIVCTASYGPFMMTPFNFAIPGPFFIRNTRSGFPRLGGFLIGMYSVKPDMGTCMNPETGAPIPAFEITNYGVSR